MPLAIDVSQWTGEITDSQARTLKPNNVKKAIVNAHPRHAEQQIEAFLKFGIEVEAYVYMLLDGDVDARVRRADALLDGHEIGRLWIDAEDTTSGLTPTDVVAKLQTAINTAISLNHKTGIYTGSWWWKPYTNNSKAFRFYPLWYAHYNDKATLDDYTPFGGWARPHMKQYKETLL